MQNQTMKTYQSVKRRDFLRTASAAGALGLLSGFTATEGSGAQHHSSSIAPQQQAKIQARLDAIAREFVTVPKEEAEFLNLLVKLTRARRILEVGTSFGYTTIWLALALEETGGKLTTIEILPERVELAKKHVTEAGLSHRVIFKQGDAHEVVPTLNGPFDFVYLDADKGGQVDYFKKLFPKKLPPGSLLIAHNAILRADAMKDYLELVRKHPEFDTLIVSATMDDGFALSYRKRAKP
jgi:predicted O-methyltransferase YrrM